MGGWSYDKNGRMKYDKNGSLKLQHKLESELKTKTIKIWIYKTQIEAHSVFSIELVKNILTEPMRTFKVQLVHEPKAWNFLD